MKGGLAVGVEWYLQAHNSGSEQLVSRKKIHSILSEYQSRTENERIVVTLPEGEVDFFVDLSDEISSLMIARPIKSSALDRIIYKIMQCGTFVLFAPDTQFPIVLHQETLDHLPDGMLEALGEPKIADNIESFSRLLQEMYA